MKRNVVSVVHVATMVVMALYGSATNGAGESECGQQGVDLPKGEPPKGPPPGKDGGSIDPSLGTTSIQMGSVKVPDSASSCGLEPGFPLLVCLADLLKSTATDELLAVMQYDYSVAQGQNWSNLPAGAFPDRHGALLGEFNAEQLGMVKAILMEAASLTANEGFDEMVQTLNADDYIANVSDDAKAGYSSYNSKFAFLGTPAQTGTWQLY